MLGRVVPDIPFVDTPLYLHEFIMITDDNISRAVRILEYGSHFFFFYLIANEMERSHYVLNEITYLQKLHCNHICYFVGPFGGSMRSESLHRSLLVIPTETH